MTAAAASSTSLRRLTASDFKYSWVKRTLLGRMDSECRASETDTNLMNDMYRYERYPWHLSELAWGYLPPAVLPMFVRAFHSMCMPDWEKYPGAVYEKEIRASSNRQVYVIRTYWDSAGQQVSNNLEERYFNLHAEDMYRQGRDYLEPNDPLHYTFPWLRWACKHCYADLGETKPHIMQMPVCPLKPGFCEPFNHVKELI
jgi:hypothetical protein